VSRRAISFVIAIAPMARPSFGASQRWAYRIARFRLDLPGKTPSRSNVANRLGPNASMTFIFSEAGLRRDLSAYVSYFNHWRPHRSIGQRTPRDPEEPRSPSRRKSGKIIADPVLGGLHHVYKLAA
jgi:transposase InsO family protein